MAKSSNLREFQEAILSRLRDVATQGEAASTSRLGVNVGSRKLLVNLSEVREVLPVPPLQVVPLTQPWFLGVANVRGNLYNVTDLAMFMGMPPTQRSANNRILLLNSDVTTQTALMIGGLVGLRSTDNMQAKPANGEEAVFFSKQSYEDAEGTEWFEADFDTLMKNKEFIQPTIG